MGCIALLPPGVHQRPEALKNLTRSRTSLSSWQRCFRKYVSRYNCLRILAITFSTIHGSGTHCGNLQERFSVRLIPFMTLNCLRVTKICQAFRSSKNQLTAWRSYASCCTRVLNILHISVSLGRCPQQAFNWWQEGRKIRRRQEPLRNVSGSLSFYLLSNTGVLYILYSIYTIIRTLSENICLATIKGPQDADVRCQLVCLTLLLRGRALQKCPHVRIWWLWHLTAPTSVVPVALIFYFVSIDRRNTAHSVNLSSVPIFALYTIRDTNHADQSQCLFPWTKHFTIDDCKT